MQNFQEFNDKYIDSILFSNHLEGIDCFLYGEPLTEQSARAKLSKQPWQEVDKKSKRLDQEDQAHVIYQNAYKIALNARKTFSSKLKKITQKIQHPKILVGIKGEAQFVEKILDRGKKARGITDILRAAILVSTPNDVQTILKLVRKEFVVVEDEFKGLKSVNKTLFNGTTDRYGHVDSKHGDEDYGYHGSQHFLIKIDDLVIELQVMTKRLWAFKEEAHLIYNKYRGVKDFDEKTKKIDQLLSKQLFKLGNSRPSKPRKFKR